MSRCWADPAAPTACEMAAAIRAGRADPVDLAEQALSRITQTDHAVGTFVHVDPGRVLAAAKKAAVAVRSGEALGPLHGVPVAVKDLFDVTGERTRAGSQLTAGPAAVTDATAVARLRRAGAVLVGRTRTHEFAWGMTTQHPVLGGTANPWDTDRVPGGSSGGSAAAVAAGVVPLALGTDTGCSIRLPAAWCGLLGHKPTFGLVPMDGVIPLAPSLDHGGALVRDAADARLALQVLSGRRLAPGRRLPGLRVGLVEHAGGPAPNAAVVSALTTAAARASDLGGALQPAGLPLAGQLPELYGTVQAGEALAWHRGTGRWPAQADSYGGDVRSLLRRCEQVSAARAAAAVRQRAELRRRTATLFGDLDLLLLPVAGCAPSRVGDPDHVDAGGRLGPLRDAVLPWTVWANLCGLPACSVPAGLDPDGLPIGVQLVGAPGADGLVLGVAEQLSARPG